MQRQAGHLVFSATDLTAYLECEHLVHLDLQALTEESLRARKSPDDDSAQLIAQKGIEHERHHLAKLIADGLSVIDVAEVCQGNRREMPGFTLTALRDGPDVVYQAALAHGPLAGYADFLMKVPGPKTPAGYWPYEAADTKLARSPKAKFLVQLAFYSHLLEQVAGSLPPSMPWCWVTSAR